MADTQAEGFDSILERLRGVVEKLEAGSLSLEESLAVFEEGVALSRRGSTILDAAEKRVEILSRAADGSERIVPLADSSSSEGPGASRPSRE